MIAIKILVGAAIMFITFLFFYLVGCIFAKDDDPFWKAIIGFSIIAIIGLLLGLLYMAGELFLQLMHLL